MCVSSFGSQYKQICKALFYTHPITRKYLYICIYRCVFYYMYAGERIGWKMREDECELLCVPYNGKIHEPKILSLYTLLYLLLHVHIPPLYTCTSVVNLNLLTLRNDGEIR